MSPFPIDDAHFSAAGAYYPTGHVFAMFSDEATARAAAERASKVPGVGAVEVAGAEAIIAGLGERADHVGGAPSLGREHQFMARFVQLAREGGCGLLVAVGEADTGALRAALEASGAMVAYHYRALVIEEIIEADPRAEAAAAGRL